MENTHHGMRPGSPGTGGAKGVGLSADGGQPARGAVSSGGGGAGAIRGAAAGSSCDAFCVLDLLDRVGSPATVATAGGRFFGFVNGAAFPVSVAATWLASAWDQNAALRVMSPAAAALEDVALGWVRDVLGLPSECGGAVVTGATMANFTGLAAARHALLERGGWDVENDGLFGAPRADCGGRRSGPRVAAEGARPVGAWPQARGPRTGG